MTHVRPDADGLGVSSHWPTPYGASGNNRGWPSRASSSPRYDFLDPGRKVIENFTPPGEAFRHRRCRGRDGHRNVGPTRRLRFVLEELYRTESGGRSPPDARRSRRHGLRRHLRRNQPADSRTKSFGHSELRSPRPRPTTCSRPWRPTPAGSATRTRHRPRLPWRKN